MTFSSCQQLGDSSAEICVVHSARHVPVPLDAGLNFGLGKSRDRETIRSCASA